MLFSSTIFLFLFFPITFVVYFLLPKKARNYWLLATSLFFYGWGEPRFVFAMVASILWNYLFALLIDRRRSAGKSARALLILSVAGNLSLLFVFKYLNFVIANINGIFPDLLPQTHIILPIGISFFTFQAMSYVFDVYRGSVPVQKNPLFVALYVSFFPQLIAGPIVRYQTIEKQITERTITTEDITTGVRRFIIGFLKKVILANTMAILADKAFAANAAGTLSVSFAWLGILCYAFQILFDFSGYSEMAIGLGRMFGFHFLENFDYPYISKTITEFWRRWHMSLGTWFRDYVYFPLGGSRVKSKALLVRNLFVVWFLTGVWHGASWNFVLWGLLFFVMITFEKLLWIPGRLSKIRGVSIAYQVLTLFIVLMGWVLFRAPTLDAAVSYAGTMFGLGGAALVDGDFIFYSREYIVVLVFCVLCSTPVFKRLKSVADARGGTLRLAGSWLPVLCYTAAFVYAVSSLIMGAHNPFIYFNF